MGKVLNKYLIISLFLVVFWIGVIPLIFTKTANVLCNKVFNSLNCNVKIEAPVLRLSLIPTANFSARKVELISSQNNFSFDFDNISFKIRLLPLLSGKVHLNSLSAENFNLEILLKEDIEYVSSIRKFLQKADITLDNINIDKFKLVIKEKRTLNPIIIEGDSFLYKFKNRYIQFKLNSNLINSGKTAIVNWDLFLPKNNDINATNFDVNIKNFDISTYKEYLVKYLPEEIVTVSGVLNVKANKDELKTKITNCKILMHDEAKSIIFPQQLDIVSKFAISREKIVFNNADFKSKGLNFSFSGNISDYLSKAKTSVDLDIQLNQSKVENIVKMLPAFRVEELDAYKLKKYGMYGDVIGNFKVQGNLPEPEILGDVYINKGAIENPSSNSVRGIVAKFKFLGRQVDFDINIPFDNAENVNVKGSQEIYNIKYADLIVKSSQNVDLKSAQNILNPLHEILNFPIGPFPIIYIEGVGNIDILIKGNRRNPHVRGVLNINNANSYFKDLKNLVLKNINSTLVFDDQNVVFTLKEGKLNDKDFLISGICNLFGKFDFNIKSDAQQVDHLYLGLKNGTMFPESNNLPMFDKLQGLADLNLRVYGNIKNLNDLAWQKNVFAKGNIEIKNVLAEFQKLKVNNLSGEIKLDGQNFNVDFNGLMDNEALSIKAQIVNKLADINVSLPKLNPAIFIEDKNLQDAKVFPIISLDAKYKGKITSIEPNNIRINANVLPQQINNYINYNSGEIKFENNKLGLNNITGNIKNPSNSFKIDLKIDKPLDIASNINGNIVLKSPNVAFLNDISMQGFLPKEINSLIGKINFINGKVDLDCKIKNKKMSFENDLSGYELIYTPLDLPIKFVNGSILLKNNLLVLDKINILADNMPILVNGTVKDILKPKFDIYVNSKPQQDFIDKYINKNQIYPIKIKGDIVYSAWLNGFIDDYTLKLLLNMSKESSFYHFGATVGDVENAIVLEMDSRIVNKNSLKIKEFLYDKLIDSQSGRQTRLNMLKAWGDVDVSSDDLGFKDLHIKTNTPTDARIFNIIFRKPNIKQGQFTSDLRISGKLSNPSVLGDFHIIETNIPFLDTTVKNISLVFKDRIIEISTKGDVLGNDILFDGVMKNKLSPPYHIEKGVLKTKNLDLNRIVNKLKIAEVDNVSTFESFEEFDLSDISFNNLKLIAESIQLRNINATEFQANTFLNQQGKFDMKDFIFNIAHGSLKGNYGYDLKSAEMDLDLKAESIDANDISWALFDLNNQIYGDLTGKINLTCNGTNFQSCMQTLSGNTKFKVEDGRMPKLGSLEYLLKAGNLVKGGFTGLSISSIVDLVTPLKTGDFSEINGNVRIKDGVARNVEISTRGKDLSLFLWGTYNFSTSIADMQVFGYLSRKITNMFGVIGNLSMNTIFNLIPGVDLSKDSEILDKINKIPGIELSNKGFRKFLAEIQGNINGEDYVTSFRWVN